MKWAQALIIGCFTGLLVACSQSQALSTYAPSGASTPPVMETTSITPSAITKMVTLTNSPTPAPTSTPFSTNTPSPSPTPFPVATFSGSPSIEKAWQALYPQSGGIIKDIKPFGVPKDGIYVGILVDGKYIDVYKVVLAAPFTENHSQKYAILTGNMTMQSLCNICYAPILGAVFVKKGNDWSVETRNDFLGELGEWGFPPQGKLVKIGLDKYGFLFLDTFQQQGITTISLALFSNANGQLKQVLVIPVISWEEIDITSDTGKKLWGYYSTYKFISGDNPEYYDLILTTTGTKPSQDLSQIEPVNEKRIYIFNGSEYVLP
jgi:hypothetical protein